MKWFWTQIWNLSEYTNIGLGRFAPFVFEHMIGHKGQEVYLNNPTNIMEHLSDCATHNMPAYPNKPCDCKTRIKTPLQLNSKKVQSDRRQDIKDVEKSASFLTMKKILCYLIGLYKTVRYFAPIEGCDYIEIENTPKSQTLKCQRCGKIDIGYW